VQVRVLYERGRRDHTLAFFLKAAERYAGMMAIPRAYYLMGWVLGTAMLLVVAYLTYWTLSVLVDATDKTGTGQRKS
jgi:hypothetical protein